VHPRRRRPRRARLGATALGAALLCLVTACTTDGDQTPASPSTTSSAPSPSSTPSGSDTPTGGPVTLRFAVYGDRAVVASYRALAAAFTRQQPRVSVQVEAAPDASSARQRLDRQYTSGTEPDVFLTDSNALPTLVGRNRVQPVDGLLEDRGLEFGDTYERLGLEAFAANSALQCMPSDVSPYVVFYNRQLLVPSELVPPGEAAPTPETGWRWAQFVQAARQISRDGTKGVYLAPELTTLTPLLRSAGAGIVDDPQQPSTLTLSDGASREPIETILQVARNARLTPTPAELARQDALTRFKQGRLGMFIGTRALVPELRQRRDLRFDVYPLPILRSFATIADVSGYCISSGTRHTQEAADFLAFASRDQGAAITARSGGVVPANLATRSSEAFEQSDQFPTNALVFSTVMRRADTMPNPPGWSDVVAQTRPLLSRLFYARVVDLDTLLPRIDRLSAAMLAGPTPSPSPTG
jgi:multiple sugar transport system substrate-binding protein